MREWINDLKIALVEENGDKLIELADNIPQTNNVELAIEACLLMQEAIKFGESQKNYLSQEMAKFRKAKCYFN